MSRREEGINISEDEIDIKFGYMNYLLKIQGQKDILIELQNIHWKLMSQGIIEKEDNELIINLK